MYEVGIKTKVENIEYDYGAKEIAKDLLFKDFSVNYDISRSYVAVDVNGQIWTWGKNTMGSLGVDTHTHWVSEPTRLETNIKFKKAVLGYRNMLLLSEDNEVYMIGYDALSKYNANTYYELVKVPTSQKFYDIRYIRL